MGSGKTVLATDITRSHERLLILATFPHEHNYGAIVENGDINQTIALIQQDRFCVVLKNHTVGPEGADSLQWLFHCVSERGDMSIQIEELSFYCKANWSMPMIKEMLRNSRHANIHMIATTQFPSQIDKEIIRLSGLYAFQINEPHSLTYLKGIWPTGGTGEESVEVLKNLPLGEPVPNRENAKAVRCVYYDVKKGERYEREIAV